MIEYNEKAKSLIPLTESTFMIILSLLQPRHGYEVMQVASRLSGGRVKIGPGTLYGAITRLEERGCVLK